MDSKPEYVGVVHTCNYFLGLSSEWLDSSGVLRDQRNQSQQAVSALTRYTWKSTPMSIDTIMYCSSMSCGPLPTLHILLPRHKYPQIYCIAVCSWCLDPAWAIALMACELWDYHKFLSSYSRWYHRVCKGWMSQMSSIGWHHDKCSWLHAWLRTLWMQVDTRQWWRGLYM